MNDEKELVVIAVIFLVVVLVGTFMGVYWRMKSGDDGVCPRPKDEQHSKYLSDKDISLDEVHEDYFVLVNENDEYIYKYE